MPKKLINKDKNQLAAFVPRYFGQQFLASYLGVIDTKFNPGKLNGVEA